MAVNFQSRPQIVNHLHLGQEWLFGQGSRYLLAEITIIKNQFLLDVSNLHDFPHSAVLSLYLLVNCPFTVCLNAATFLACGC